jgi:hypothetical protein
VAPGGGWLGPQSPLTHLVPNLFADDGLTCQDWSFGQCKMPGRQLVFIVGGSSLGGCLLICVGGIVACCRCRKRKARGLVKGASADNVPLLGNVPSTDDLYSEADLQAESAPSSTL